MTSRVAQLIATLSMLPLVASGLSGCAIEDQELTPEEESELNNQAWEELASGKADTSGCSGIVTPDQGDFGKRIALTFDDGPNLDNTPRVLDILAAHNAKATFFIVGRSIRTEAHKALLRRMKAEGHLVGSHSYSHANFKAISASKARDEIRKTKQILADVGISDPYFRFPYGNGSCTGAEIARSEGYHVVGWQFGSNDWCYQVGNGYCPASTFRHIPDRYRRDEMGYIQQGAAKDSGGIMVNHDIHRYTAETLDAILTMLEEQGYSFVNLDDTSVFPRLNGLTPPPEPWVGAPCADDAACSFSGSGRSASCHAWSPTESSEIYGFCSIPCQGTCPDKAGWASTFCVTLDGGSTGNCVAKAGAANDGCAKIPGTTARVMQRFVGTSSAAPASATVCVP